MASNHERYDIFVKEYVATHNATRAAKKAGYSEKTAYSQGNRLLKNAEVKKKIKAEEKRVAKKLEVNQEKVLKELAKIAFSDASDYYQIAYSEKHGTFVFFTPTDELTPDQRSAISEIGYGKHGPYVKLHNKLQALNKLGEHLGIFKPEGDEIEDIDEERKKVFGDD